MRYDCEFNSEGNEGPYTLLTDEWDDVLEFVREHLSRTPQHGHAGKLTITINEA